LVDHVDVLVVGDVVVDERVDLGEPASTMASRSTSPSTSTITST